MIKLHYNYTEEIKDFIENGLSTKMEYDEEYDEEFPDYSRLECELIYLYQKDTLQNSSKEDREKFVNEFLAKEKEKETLINDGEYNYYFYHGELTRKQYEKAYKVLLNKDFEEFVKIFHEYNDKSKYGVFPETFYDSVENEYSILEKENFLAITHFESEAG